MGQTAFFVAMVLVVISCLVFLVLSIWTVKKKQDRKNEHLDKVSQVIEENRNQSHRS